MPFTHYGTLVPRISDEPVVASAWERFLRDHPHHPHEGDGVRRVVLASWQRCRSEAVDPTLHSAPGAADDRLRQLRTQNRDLCDAAGPALEGLRDILRECGTLIMLSDTDGTILQLNGSTRVRSVGEEVNLAMGGCWSEEVIGTNAIGTAIATVAPVQIHASEHFCWDVKRWTCAAAPILDPFGRHLLGVVDVSGVKESFHGHTLGLVVAAARQIESELARRDMAMHERLLARSIDDFVRYASDCVVLADFRGRVVRIHGRAQAARDAHGVCFALETGNAIPGLDLTLPEGDQIHQRPGWLRPEWLHTVKDREGLLGTMLVIPLAARPGRTSISLPATPTAVTTDDAFTEIIGESEILAATKARARRIASLDLPVLLVGETGAGKELFARALHRSGKRPDGPFVAVNCGALTRELLASELFGYAEGAFTGARRGGHPGKFEQAAGGTLFLDEIGEMPLDMQPHLLRVLQDGVVVRLGDTRERQVSVRLVAATNRDLQKEIAAGRFREDLYHRLCAVSLQLPALRDRPGDIESIVDHLNHKLARKYGCAPKQIEPSVYQTLVRYRWPGNIRELQNVFEVMFALGENNGIDVSMLSSLVESGPAGDAMAPAPMPMSAASGRLDDLERQAIRAAINDARGNLSKAARTLGISRSTLYVKLAALRT
ncbi:sigma-54 dependent transcriptional regulator, acetoin dehydrogenase operon transcriptional activator AcoR [Cupriavidus metallidurans]|jgi:transcriptional regulator of acetoin/glycerol metabolism|uniref:sigma-54-dependent Fis family transcriptional regulator n=1 Tax=Cupriavidus TaxID=106589 RepID=UPI0004934777|nr:sigma-54-dependent Fis family transcriptional regulator [Cupriavidus metallidurans]AVA34862.1 sigma-54-dependent Fis family transcriptional regulator [Cupriavidus metallidurans]KWW39548.1 Acetoin dehydrogenase operon transcriptional activator AcoR [Cupriavidus metallidurans]MDE4920765.1 sigma-54-dependent Fis family transcriptional regulator [Cupriavidus metallidurans]